MAVYALKTPWHSEEFSRGMRAIPGAMFDSPAARGSWIYPVSAGDAVKALRERCFGRFGAAVKADLSNIAEISAKCLDICRKRGWGEDGAPQANAIALAFDCHSRGQYDECIRTLVEAGR